MTAQHESVVPLIDFGPFLGGTLEGKRKVAQEISQACEHIGFFLITGHGVAQSLIEKTQAVSREYFALPVEGKSPAPYATGSLPGLHTSMRPNCCTDNRQPDTARSRRTIRYRTY